VDQLTGIRSLGKTCRDPFNESPLPHSFRIDAALGGQQQRSLSNQSGCVSGEERLVVLSHRHAEIVLWL
jgi:hypothetical protein